MQKLKKAVQACICDYSSKIPVFLYVEILNGEKKVVITYGVWMYLSKEKKKTNVKRLIAWISCYFNVTWNIR